MNGKRTDKTADQNTQPYENHICLISRTVNISHLPGSSFHFMLHSCKFEDISRIHHRLRKYRNIDTCTLDAADADTMHEFLCPDRRNLFSRESPVSNHDRQRLRRKIE